MKNNENKRNVILSESQISELFGFVKSKNVKYMDVTHEIVDHLASAIEDKMNKDENLTFDQALRLIYSDFPITGFYYFVQEKEKAQNKYWNKVIKEYALSYLRPIEMLLVIAMISIMYISIMIFGSIAALSILVIAFIYHLYFLYFNYSYFKKKGIQKENYLVTTSYYTRFGNLFFAPGFMFMLFDGESILRFKPTSPWGIAVYALLLSLFILWTYGCVNYFPKRLLHDLSSKYSHIDGIVTKSHYHLSISTKE